MMKSILEDPKLLFLMSQFYFEHAAVAQIQLLDVKKKNIFKNKNNRDFQTYILRFKISTLKY